MYKFDPGNALELVSQGWDYLRSAVYKELWMPSNLSSSNQAWSLQFLSDTFPKMRARAVFLISLSAIFGNAQEACDAECQAAFKELQGLEASSWVSKNVTFDTFYSTPSNSTGAQPGDLLRWEDVPQSVVNQNFTIPGGMSLFRFLYMSEDIDRKPIPASAFVLLPYNKPDPNQPFNTTVWAHGTAGRIRNCAPSNHKDLYYEWQGPFTLATAGYAVIAPDYAGQGSDIPQGFMYEAGYLHAADVAYSLIAARKVIGEQLSKDWVVVGHSEGGMTAWRTAERLSMPDQEELLKAGNLLGAVANSPALRPLDLIPESVRRAAGGPIGDAVSVLFFQSLQALFPDQFRLKDYLTDTAVGRIPLADQGCLLAARALFADLTADQMFKNMNWLENPAVVDWQKRYNGAGPHALAVPMLVVQGVTDKLVYANNTELDFNRTCEEFPKSKATLRLYPGLDHDTAGQAPFYDILTWVKDRFAGIEVADGCTTETIQPATDRYRRVGTSYSGTSS